MRESTQGNEISDSWGGGGAIILSGILYRDRRQESSVLEFKEDGDKWTIGQQLCKGEEVGFVDLWDSFVVNEEMYMIDGMHLSGKEAAVFADGLKQAVDSGLSNTRYLNYRWAGGNWQRKLTADKRIAVPRHGKETHPKQDLKCACLKGRSIINR